MSLKKKNCEKENFVLKLQNCRILLSDDFVFKLYCFQYIILDLKY